MKLLFENWREYLKEEETEDLAVELVGDIMYYGAETPEPGRLFVVVEFEVPWWGERMKYGFYTTSAESMGGDSKLPAGSWVPAKYIRDDGVIQKIENKYPRPGFLLADVAEDLYKTIPPEKQDELKREAKRRKMKAYRATEPAKRSEFDQAWIANEIKTINDAFKEHKVYDIKTKDPYTGRAIS